MRYYEMSRHICYTSIASCQRPGGNIVIRAGYEYGITYGRQDIYLSICNIIPYDTVQYGIIFYTTV